jgi:hypothetical protein
LLVVNGLWVVSRDEVAMSFVCLMTILCAFVSGQETRTKIAIRGKLEL